MFVNVQLVKFNQKRKRELQLVLHVRRMADRKQLTRHCALKLGCTRLLKRMKWLCMSLLGSRRWELFDHPAAICLASSGCMTCRPKSLSCWQGSANSFLSSATLVCIQDQIKLSATLLVEVLLPTFAVRFVLSRSVLFPHTDITEFPCSSLL